MSLPLSKLPHGVLNERIREKIYQSFDLDRDNFMDVFRKIISSEFGEQYSIVNQEFTGVCLYVLSNEEKQSLVTAGAFEKIADTSKKKLKKLKACRVFIPEIHTDRALPDDIYNLSKKDKIKIESMFPVFISETEEVANKSLKPGNLLKIKVKNNQGGGTYLSMVDSSSSSVNIFNQNTPRDDLFQCKIVRVARIINAQGRSVSFGEVITSEKEQSGNALDEATLKQQYKKFLTEKEAYWYSTLKNYWTLDSPDDPEITLQRTAFKKFLNRILVEIDIPSNGFEKLVWLLLEKLSVYSPTGVTNAGLTVLNVDSIDDSYGIFKTTKEQFDTYQLDYEQGYTDSGDLQLSDLSDFEQSFFVDNAYQHEDLLDPDVSMRFFVMDFLRYLNKNNSDYEKISNLSDEKNQKIITNYFTKNDKKIKFIFSTDYQAIADQWDDANIGDSNYDNPKIKTAENIDKAIFPDFRAWLSAAAGGAAVEIDSFIKQPSEANENSDLLQEEEPRDTSDECHDNYPQRNSYLEHVDAQKKLMRRYIKSISSGEDLDFLKYMHKGTKSVVISDVETPAPFKVIRYDGKHNYKSDQKRWFNERNNTHLNFNRNYKRGYYRPSEFITKVTFTTLDLKDGSELENFKLNLDLMYDLNKPVPHFLITQTGQIIQLVDVAAVVNNNLANKNTSVNISFTEGIGNINILEGQKNSVIDNYILVNTDPETSVYRPHKIGSKASLQAADRLVKYLTSITNLKYNVAAQDFKLKRSDINKTGIQAYGHYKGISGMNFIYYAWTYGLAYNNGGRNILSKEYGYN
tara:strand:- start:975 stop:3374 length:2400 start_codon:yes stop_codon:yes gene_type:complete